MFSYIAFSGLAIIKYSANTSTANPGQQEDFVVLAFDSFQNSML